jgi:hypothetical protein
MLSPPAVSTLKTWRPPAEVSREAVIAISDEVLARPDLAVRVHEDVFPIRTLDLDWDIGGAVYEPEDASRIPIGADGKRAGLFLLHGGAEDHRDMDPMARLLAGRFGFKVATMTFPGQLYLSDESRDWPNDTCTATARFAPPSGGRLGGPELFEVLVVPLRCSAADERWRLAYHEGGHTILVLSEVLGLREELLSVVANDLRGPADACHAHLDG